VRSYCDRKIIILEILDGLGTLISPKYKAAAFEIPFVCTSVNGRIYSPLTPEKFDEF
jgi:hypothetical protein